MGFLQQLLSYGSICIQCHNSPDSDTLASASQEFRLTSYNAMLQSYSQFPNTLAQKLIKQALKPLGADYAARPDEMFWGDAIDVYPFENKTIGGGDPLSYAGRLCSRSKY